MRTLLTIQMMYAYCGVAMPALVLVCCVCIIALVALLFVVVSVAGAFAAKERIEHALNQTNVIQYSDSGSL